VTASSPPLRWFCALLVAVSSIVASGCSYTLTEPDCSRYRDHLIAWAAAKGADRKAAAEEFYKTCPGTPVSKSTHDCLEKATDEAAFMKCLGQ
jgi:hypothetical protein